MNYSFIRKYVTRPSFALVFIAIVLVAGVIYSNIYHYPFVFDDKPQIEDKVIIRDITNYLSIEAFLKPRPIVDLTFALNYRFGQLAVFGYHLVNVLIHIINGFLVYFLALTIFKQLLSGSTQRFGGSSKLKGGRGKVKAQRGKVKGRSSKVKARSSKDNPKHRTSNILLSDGSAAYTGFQSSNPPVNFSPSHLLNFSSSSPPHPFTLSPFQQISFMSLFAALIFVAHPIQTQAVTYTVQRYASLAAMFYMGSVLFYLKARIVAQGSKLKAESSELARRQSGGVGGQSLPAVSLAGSEKPSAFSLQLSALYSLSIICGMLAFLSKQNTASLPAAIILVEYLFIDRTWQGWKKKILWFTPAFIVFVIFVLYVCGFFSGGYEGRGLLEDVSELARETKLVSRWEYLCTQFNVLMIYIRLLFWPIRQNLYYNYPFKDGFFDDLTPFAFAFLAGLVVLSVWKRKKYPVFTVALFWFFITLSVESSIFPIKDAIFEHRLYLPMFGFALFVVWLFFRCLPKRSMLAVLICVSIVISMGTATYLRNRIWQNRVTMWTDVLAKSPQNPRAYLNLGSAFGSEKRYEAAIQCYNRVLKFYPDNVRANYNMGIMLEEQGDTDRAINYYRKALRIDPRKAKAHNKLGAILLGKGDTDGALKHLSEAVRLNPENVKMRNNLGCAFEIKGDLEDAVRCYAEALMIKPGLTEAYMNLSRVSKRVEDPDMAVSYFRRILRSDTENINIHTDLGITLMRLGNIQGACDHFSEAVRIDPENAEAHYNLGLTFFKQERMDKAAEQYLKSLRIRPQNASSHYNLALVLHRRGDFQGAIGHFENAMRLNSGLKLQASYNIARAYARQGKTGESVKWLQRAVAVGFNNWTDLETDKDFKNIRDTLYYRKIIGENRLKF